MIRRAAGKLLLPALLTLSLASGLWAADSKPVGGKRAKAGTTNAKPPASKPADTKVAAKKETEKKDADDKKETAAKPATHKIKKIPFHIEVNLDGVFEAQNTAELVIRPQEWPLLQVVKAVDHGTAVKQGDLVLLLDTDKIDHAIADLREEIKLNDLAVKQSETQLAALDKIAPLDEDANRRARRMVAEDWKQYQDVEKPLSVKLNDYRLTQAKEALDYAEEEYRQLEKMYKADDLREETEKIVLRRAKNGVDRAKLSLELSQAAYDETKKLALPRQDEKAKEQTDRAMIDVEYTQAVLPLLISKQRLDLEKLQLTRALADDKLKNLTADRDAMIVKAPIDGIVYYGHAMRGKWIPTSLETLRRGATVVPNEVFMTIVQSRPLSIHTTVPEGQFQRIRVGQQAFVDPNGFLDAKLMAVVNRVGSVPLAGSGFDCELTVAADKLNAAIMPGMSCDLKLITYQKADALIAPAKSVFTEDLDPTKEYVYLVGKDGKRQKRNVKTGERNDKQVEILTGLAAGDEILAEKPKDDDE